MMHIPSLQELGEEIRGSDRAPEARSAGKTSKRRTSSILIATDALTMALVLAFAIVLRTMMTQGAVPFFDYLLIGSVLILGNTLASSWRGIYPGYGTCAIAELRSTFYTVTGVFGLVIVLSFFMRDWPPYARSVLLTAYVLSVPFIVVSRNLTRKFLSSFEWYGVPVLIIGIHGMATRIVDTLRNHKQIGLKPLAIIEPDAEGAEYGYHNGVPIIGGLELIERVSYRYAVNHGIVAMPYTSGSRISGILDDHCRHLAHVTLVGEHVHPSVIWISNSASDILMTNEIEQRLRHPALILKKRLFDLAFGIPIFILSLPIMILIGIAVALSMGRPILYRQKRVGVNGKWFTVVKFRTMVQDAEQSLQAILESNPASLHEWNMYRKLKSDPRIVGIGKFLRKYSLDELPQLWNVLRGDMSLIGFRPFLKEELESIAKLHTRVPTSFFESVKPGMSGLWQVTVRSDAAFEERLHIDLYYMRNWSLFLDLYLLFRTISVVVTGRGGY